MLAFAVLALAGVALARPEPPVGYNYQAPLAVRQSAAPSSVYARNGGYASGGGGYASGGSAGGYSLGGAAGHSSGGSTGGYSLGNAAGHSSGGLSHSSGGASFGGQAGFAGGYSGQQAAIIQKHIYVHVPPPEQAEVRQQYVPAPAPPQKHYKIIFIKAPAAPAQPAPIFAPQAQNEEKTLVYVLVKKPEEQADIVIPTAAPTQPSKPEVYFIKYQTQKESGVSGAGISGGAVGGGSGLGSGPELSNVPGSGVELADFPTGGADDGASSGALSSSTGSNGSPAAKYGPPGH